MARPRKQPRQRDIIDVNRAWSVYLGRRSDVSYWVANVRHATVHLAFLAARVIQPTGPIYLIEDEGR
ncbi:hypothetical protein ACFOKF_16440 [Sphingobium rhizovicinum]|uniref:Uncharacterized protein n=1 Tax=Sphingobium rhizovicinum TaxID=432308 RepID=A0ABV7NID6_9SPHN